MGDTAEENYEGPVDSQEPLTQKFEIDDDNDNDNAASLRKKDFKKIDIRSFWLAVFNLMNAILGSGILGLADAMKNLGVVVFYILLLLTGILADYTIRLLLVASDKMGVTTYEDLATKTFGMPGRVATSIMTIFHCFGAICSYLYITKTELPEVMKVIVMNTANATMTDEHGSTNSPWYIQGTFLMIIVVIFILPLTAKRDISFLGYTSAIGMLCMLIFVFTVVVKKFSIPCPLSNHSENSFLNYTGEKEQTCKADIAVITDKTAYAMPTMIFAFMCHVSVHPIYRHLRRPTMKTMHKVSRVSIFSVLALYFLSASFGYFTFYNYVLSEMLLTYSLYDPADPIIVVTRCMVLVCVGLSIPVLHFSCRETIVFTFIPREIQKKYFWFIHLGTMFAILSTAVVLVIVIPNIRDIFGLSGATSSTTLLIIFPCAFYLRAVKSEPGRKHKLQRIAVMGLLVTGILFMIGSVTLIMIDWIK